MPKLSIIIPTFNSSACIEECLRSIASQTFSDYEVIVQDGCSSDGTVDKIRNFQRSDPGIDVKLAIEKDKGPYDAMNRGVRGASGEWLYFLGSDDQFHDRDVLRVMLGGLDLAAYEVIYGNVKMLGEPGWSYLYDGVFDLKKLLNRNICHQSIFYRAEFLRRVGEYNTNYVIYADWDFNLRCWSRTAFRYADVVVADFRVGGLSSSCKDDSFRSEVAANVLRYFGLSAWHRLVDTPAFVGFEGIVRMQDLEASSGRLGARARRALARARRVLHRSHRALGQAGKAKS